MLLTIIKSKACGSHGHKDVSKPNPVAGLGASTKGRDLSIERPPDDAARDGDAVTQCFGMAVISALDCNTPG